MSRAMKDDGSRVRRIRPQTEVPYDADAEESALGACLLSVHALSRFADQLSPADFYKPANQEICSAILDLFARREPVDGLTVAAELRRQGKLDEVGGKPYLFTLAHSTPSAGSVSAYARIVRADARRRAVLQAAAEIQQEAAKPDRSTEDLVDLLAVTAATLQAEELQRSDRLVSGGALLDAPLEVPIIWGLGAEVGWAQGEALVIVGPPGVGKSTLMQRLVLARIGIGPSEVLGYPIGRTDRPVLYVAADRPAQIFRSWRRMLRGASRDRLDEMLRIWRNPLPFDVGAEPARLARMAEDLGVGTIAIDSLKDVALDLSKDETGSRVARAFQEVAAAGIELVVTHHGRKAQGDNRKPKALDDVYGSAWITAGAGSVVLLWGKPGDPLVELSHLKQPAGDLGPFKFLIDHDTGALDISSGTDLLGILRAAPRGLTVRDAAVRLYETSEPDKAEVQRARRSLGDLVERGLAHKESGGKTSGGLQEPDTYFATRPQGSFP